MTGSQLGRDMSEQHPGRGNTKCKGPEAGREGSQGGFNCKEQAWGLGGKWRAP